MCIVSAFLYMSCRYITTHFVQFSIMSIDFTLEASSKLRKKKTILAYIPQCMLFATFQQKCGVCATVLPRSLDSDLMIILLSFFVCYLFYCVITHNKYTTRPTTEKPPRFRNNYKFK